MEERLKARKSHRDHDAEHVEMVRLWFEFLRLNDSYRKCCMNGGTGEHAELYSGFGDIHRVSFDRWYSEREELFRPEYFYLDPIESQERFNGYHAGGTLVVAVNLEKPRKELEAQFAKLLRSQGPAKRGRRSGHDLSMAPYPLRKGPKASTLRKILEAHRLKLEHPEYRSWRIGQLVYAPRRETEKKLDVDEKHRYHVLGTRALAHAQSLIENAAINCFPVTRHVEDRRKYLTYREAAIEAVGKFEE